MTLNIIMFVLNILQDNMILHFAKWLVRFPFLRAFVKLRKATITFVMTARLSVLPHGTTRLTIDGFS
jgi:hypothetical protein